MPDTLRRHGMLILIIGFTVVFLSSSIKNTYQVFFVPMSNSFDITRGDFAIAASVFMLVFGLTSPIVGILSDRIGPKRTILFGLVLSGVAMVGCALTPSFAVFVFLYGVVAAFGLTAMSYVPMGVLVDQSFAQKHKGLAYATLTNGAAIGFVILSPVWVYSQSWASWQSIYAILGVVFLVPLLLLVWRSMPNDAPSVAPSTPPAPFLERTRFVFKVPPFYALMFGFMGCGVTMAFIDVHLVAHLQDAQYSQAQISTSLSVLGALELVGGFLAGWMCGRYPKSYVIAGFYLLRAASLVVLLLMPNFTGVLLFAALFGLSYMGTVIGTSMYTLELFGKDHKGFAFGFIWLVHQIGAFFSTQLGANAHDWFGDYQRTMIATGVIALVSFFISLVFLPRETQTVVYRSSAS